jgi:hypothetical protein
MNTPGQASRAGSPRQPPWFWPAIGIAVALVVLLVGYWLTAAPSNEELPVAYGGRRGTEQAKSASGTGVLADLFKAAGNRVSTARRLSPRLNDADTIVWAPDDFAPPTQEQREFLENWLTGGDQMRTVVYIGRDFDAASAYWNEIKPTAPPEDAGEIQRRLARAKADYASARAKMPVKEYARWFTAKRDGQRRDIRTLEGEWAAGVDAKACEITLHGRLDIPTAADRTASDPELSTSFEPLLTSQGDTLAMRATDDAWYDGQVIVLANGSWVLNYPLINREHRRLATRLVNECSRGRVVFVESGEGGPPVLDRDPGAASDEAWPPWPLNAMLFHATILGIIVCLARSPIFGRPRELPAEPAADFGKHVAALGELLARAKDRNYAQSRLQQYRELAKRDSGKSHLKGK